MSVKIFLITIALTALITVTGFAYWLFPLISRFNQAMGGPPLQDPTGSVEQQLNIWLSFLPANGVQRAVVIVATAIAYILWVTLTALIALQLRRRREERVLRATSQARTMHAYNAHR